MKRMTRAIGRGWGYGIGVWLGCVGMAGAGDVEAERASFRVLDGFEVTLFATEGEGAVKPIQLRFDPDGRLWLVGSTAYPQVVPGEPADDRVTVLEDTDGDGRADRHTVFAGGLQIPTGLEWGHGGVYVGAATELLHFQDTNGDGRADARRVVLRGFGTGDSHQTLNSLAWGPSGELMFSQGLHVNSRVETPWGVAELRQAGVWRYWPRRVKLEAFWNGAMGQHNPFGTVFDRWGQPLIFAGNGHGIHHLTPAMIDTDRFLLHPPIWNRGRKFGGADVVENSHWPEANQGEVISGGYLHNSVERFRFFEEGSSFRVERLPPLIETTNAAFRIVDVRFGPDGALYLCDWHNAVIGHYQTSLRHPDRDRTRGRIWRVSARGRPTVAWQPLSGMGTDALLDRLASSERWERQMARRVLESRGVEEVTSMLTRWLAAPVGGRPHGETLDDHGWFEVLGVWAGFEVVDTRALDRVAASATPEARAYAARVTGHWATRLRDPWVRLERLVTDPHPRVRLEAVVALGQVPSVRAVEVALRAVDREMDGAIEYALTQVVRSMERHWRPVQDRDELDFGGVAERRLVFARITGGADAARYAAERLRRIGEVALDEDRIGELAGLVATGGDVSQWPVLLAPRSFMVGTNYLGVRHGATLERLAEWSGERGLRPDRDVASALGALLESREAAVAGGTALLVGTWALESLRERVMAMAEGMEVPLRVRQRAMAGEGRFGDDAARRRLVAWSRTAEPREARVGAVLALVRLDAAAAAESAAALMAGPLEPESVRELIGRFTARRDGASVLAEALTRKHPERENAGRALAVLAASGRRDEALALALSGGALPGDVGGRVGSETTWLGEVRTLGDARRGKTIFEREALGCVACHSVGGGSGKVGPDLGALGTSQTLEAIWTAIVDPQREVKEGFVAHEIETRDGEIHQGYLAGETEREVTLFDPASQRAMRIERERIVLLRGLGSLMPEGLVDELSREEARDLMAYLGGLGRRE
ncbi:MAG: c-type cytochrome [Verrucomicrobiae bacterium]|nr:c-type cytochrome [Verrucomicrobiae bacterium]